MLHKIIESKMEHKVELARTIAETAHDGQYICKRDGVTPYITHVNNVVELLEGSEAKIVGYLHNTLEMSDYTYKDLIKEGIPAYLVAAIITLTLTENQSHIDYIMKIRQSKLATKVKIAEIVINLTNEPTYKQIQYYTKMLTILSKKGGD
ncbi:MAG: hypothetical protein ACE5GV_05985 [Candidatus Scalindua sp.]